jgi:hypothetical protein
MTRDDEKPKEKQTDKRDYQLEKHVNAQPDEAFESRQRQTIATSRLSKNYFFIFIIFLKIQFRFATLCDVLKKIPIKRKKKNNLRFISFSLI